jgi:hypothetical protein
LEEKMCLIPFQGLVSELIYDHRYIQPTLQLQQQLIDCIVADAVTKFDGVDNNCNGFIDGKDSSYCPEGAGSPAATPEQRNCEDNNDNDVPGVEPLGSPFADEDDYKCCDTCVGLFLGR